MKKNQKFVMILMLVASMAAFGCASDDDDSSDTTNPPVSTDGTTDSTTEVKTYTVGGEVEGLSGSLVLRLGADEELTLSADGQYVFTKAIADGRNYKVYVKTAPDGQKCSVKNAKGKVSGANVDKVDIECEGKHDHSSVAITRNTSKECIGCHAKQASDFIESIHWKWSGPSPNMVGSESKTTNGKLNTVNNFCIAIASNEGRCTQCHAGYGYVDNTFDFTNKEKIDCLVCHDTTGTYKKSPSAPAGGLVVPATDADGNPITGGISDDALNTIAKSVGKSSRQNCGSCHFGAGGGDNVKKGDLYSSLTNPTKNMDVHMGTDGQNMTCATCHDSDGHKILGDSLHTAVTEGSIACEDCHAGKSHTNVVIDAIHTDKIACQTCHIPAFSRQKATKTWWDWSKAGEDKADEKDADGNVTYTKMKGEFIWQKNVRPSYAWWNGKINRLVVGDATAAFGAGTEADPIKLASPVGQKGDGKIFPFKVMKGIQMATATEMIVPHLFPGPVKGADTAFWKAYDYEKSFTAGMDYLGKTYAPNSNQWVYTEMWMGINHEVAESNNALGCNDCHGSTEFNWTALGYSGDPKQ